jgi:hypothetical protein
MNGRRTSLADATADPAPLLEAYIPGLRRFAQALLRGDRERADDLVQDTLERALSSWRLRRVESELRGWLYTILYNRFLSDRERWKRRNAYNTLTEIIEDELPGVNSPWGMTRASFAFGRFNGLILVGNFGNGKINVFSSQGQFIDELDRPNGKRLVVDGLWKLILGGGRNSNSETLYFTAGPNGETDGVFGTITPASKQ